MQVFYFLDIFLIFDIRFSRYVTVNLFCGFTLTVLSVIKIESHTNKLKQLSTLITDKMICFHILSEIY